MAIDDFSARVVRISDGAVFPRNALKGAEFRKRDGRGKGAHRGFALLPHQNTDPVKHAEMLRRGNGFGASLEQLRQATVDDVTRRAKKWKNTKNASRAIAAVRARSGL